MVRVVLLAHQHAGGLEQLHRRRYALRRRVRPAVGGHHDVRHPAGVDEEKAETGVAAAQQPGRAHGDADEVVLPQKVLPRAAGDGTRVVVVGLYTNEGAVSFLISIFFFHICIFNTNQKWGGRMTEGPRRGGPESSAPPDR